MLKRLMSLLALSPSWVSTRGSQRAQEGRQNLEQIQVSFPAQVLF